MISSEYGWNDETILDLTFARFRQITTAITYRRHVTRKERLRALSWQTRNIVKWVALGIQIQVDRPKDEPLISELAEQSVWVDEEEREDLEFAAELARRRQVSPEPRAGSTEALLAAFGGAMKR